MTESHGGPITLPYATPIPARSDWLCLRSLRWFVLSIGLLLISIVFLSIGSDLIGRHIFEPWPPGLIPLGIGLVCLTGSLVSNIVSMVFGYIAWFKHGAVRWWVIVSTVVWLLVLSMPFLVFFL